MTSVTSQGAVPFWPSVLAVLTGYSDMADGQMAAAIAHADRLASKLYSLPMHDASMLLPLSG
jgi:hypothetical protein